MRFPFGKAATAGLLFAAVTTMSANNQDGFEDKRGHQRAKNVIFFIGDGMGVSTITATRVYSVGVDGQLVLDQFPYTALSRTYSADSITPDSAPTMSAMMTGVNTNQSVLGLDAKTEPSDFNKDGDGRAPWTLLELAKSRGMKVGVVSTAQITHATPAATYITHQSTEQRKRHRTSGTPNGRHLQSATWPRCRRAHGRRPPVLCPKRGRG